MNIRLLLASVAAMALLLPAPSAAAKTGSEVAQALRAEIPAMMSAAGAVGLTIALVDGDDVVMAEGFGLADAATGRRVDADTLFHIGSISKTLAALAVMQLVEDGKVDLDEPLSSYLPGFRLRPRFADSTITVRSVLDHHSGIPGDVFNGMITHGEPDPGFRPWLRAQVPRMLPQGPPDTVFAYNNSGYVLLQDLIEHVTGQPLEQYARARLFGPMRMASSRFDDTKAPAARLTRNYQAVSSDDGVITTVARPREFVNGWTAGSITSSADDMSRYVRTLLAFGKAPGGRVVSRPTLERMWTRQVDSPLDISPTTFGLGFGIGDYAMDWAGKVVWHDGATVWNHSIMQLLPDSGIGVFVSSNTTTSNALSAEVAHRALTLAYQARTGRTPPPPTTLPDSLPAQRSIEQLAQDAGLYAASSSVLRVDATVDGLSLTSQPGTAGASTTALRPLADGTFQGAGASTRYSFRTVKGRHLVLAAFASPDGARTVIVGQRVPPGTLTPKWRALLGTYRAVDARPNVDASLVARTLVLRELDGALLMDLDNEWGTQALNPGRSGSAFTYGLGPSLARGKGDAVTPRVSSGGVQTLTYLGVTYARSPEH